MKLCDLFKPESEVQQNQRKHNINFDIQLKTDLAEGIQGI